MHRTYLYIGAILLVSCTAPSTFTADDERAIRQVMADQERDWDKGDIPAFMEGYTDSVCFIGAKSGKNCGKAAVTANYQKHYPDKAAMGDLAFDNIEVLGAGADNAWCTGQWTLYRQADTVSGGFSLLWQRTPKGWRIFRDHTY